MTTKLDQGTAQPFTNPDVSTGWSVQYGLLYLGTCIAWAGPSQLLLGIQLLEIRPDDKESALATMMMLGGFVMVVTTFFTGWLSDRTRTRWGQRMPWILGAGVACAIALTAMSFTPSYATLLVLWAIFQAFMAFATNNALTIAADTVPQHQYGMISGVLGASYTLGLVTGTIISVAFDVQVAYIVSGVAMVGLILQMFSRGGVRTMVAAEERNRRRAATLGDDGIAKLEFEAALEDANATDVTHSQAVANTNPTLGDYRNYAWVFISRFLAHLGNYVALFYLLYYLRDHIGLADPDTGVMILTLVYAACTVAAALISGKISDKVQRRKIFVIFATLGVSAACVIMAGATMMWTVVVSAAILGVAWGVFTSVDQAMIIESLPSAKNFARDTSLMTLTVGITNMLSGGVAALALHYLGGYPGLYLLCAVACLFGSLTVLPITSSR